MEGGSRAYDRAPQVVDSCRSRRVECSTHRTHVLKSLAKKNGATMKEKPRRHASLELGATCERCYRESGTFPDCTG